MDDILTIITSLSSGLIGAILVFFLVQWEENQKRDKKRKFVANAFRIEIEKYQKFFQKILSDYQSLKDVGFVSTSDAGDTTNYQKILFNEIVDWPAIASTGNNSGILNNNSPFIEFHKDIFEFNNEVVVAELAQYCDHIFIADKFFKNYCEINTRNEENMNKFIINFRRAYELMQGGKSISYLTKLAQLDYNKSDKSDNAQQESRQGLIAKTPLEKAIFFLTIIATIAAVISIGLQVLVLPTLFDQILGIIVEIFFIVVIILAAKIALGFWPWDLMRKLKL